MILNKALTTGEGQPFCWGCGTMEDGNRWRQRAAEMRKQAAQGKEPFIVEGFLALATEYDRLAEEGARWIQAQMPTTDRTPAHHPTPQPAAGSSYRTPKAVNARN